MNKVFQWEIRNEVYINKLLNNYKTFNICFFSRQILKLFFLCKRRKIYMSYIEYQVSFFDAQFIDKKSDRTQNDLLIIRDNQLSMQQAVVSFKKF